MRMVLVGFVKIDDFFTLVSAAGRTDAMWQFGGFALWADRNGAGREEIVRPSHIFAGFGSLFLRYCHVESPFCGETASAATMWLS